MNRRKEIKKIVSKILDTEEYARQDDNYLILRAIQEVEPELAGTTFVNVMQRLSYKGVSCESITRARREWASKNPDLKVDKAERARRQKEEEYYLEYAEKHIPFIEVGEDYIDETNR